MKISLCLSVVLVLAFLFAPVSSAQEMKSHTKVILDTTLVHAAVVTLAPGEKTDLHTHPANFFYALTDGKLVVHYADGKDETYDLKEGLCGFGDPERPHVSENAGKKTLKFLIVELKEHPYTK